MKIADLIPSTEDRKRLQEIESTLLNRRAAGTLAGLIAVSSAALQAVFAIADKSYFKKLTEVVESAVTLRGDKLAAIGFDRKTAITWGVLFVAAAVFYLMRRTSVLLKESKEAFRYTFFIEPFAEVEKTPGKRFKLGSSDRFALLHHDLTERLNQRVRRRFSLLKEPHSGTGIKKARVSGMLPARYSSHIHITGHYATREANDGTWLVHILPEIRIGPPGSPATLPQPIKYPLDVPEERSEMPEALPKTSKEERECNLKFEARQYLDIVERVYSSIATELYRQLDSDVRQKIALFPTPRLRAIALYHEAEDFARSNTIDAYERAIALYREAFRYFEGTSRRLSTRLLLPLPFFWRFEVKRQHEWARVVAGYATCLIYRREMSAITGREGNVLYELPELLEQAIAPLSKLQQHISKRNPDNQLERTLAYLVHPPNSRLRRRVGPSEAPRLEAQRNALFELHVAAALTQHFLGCREEALRQLANAAASAPDKIARNPLYLVAKGLLEPVIDKAIVHFRRAVELDPDFLIARWFLARFRESALRQRDEISAERVQIALSDYREVVTLNFGNILALSAQGYLRWLIHDSEARRYLEEGRQVKAIVRDTFVGELNYRLARIAAETGKFEECCSLYLEAIAADPEIGAVYPGFESRVRSADFDQICYSMLHRFGSYKKNVEDLIKRERNKAAECHSQAKCSEKPVTEDTLRIVHTFVLNDYANACLRYFHYHGDHPYIRRAIAAYEEAKHINPFDARPWFNLQNAYSWTGEREKSQECYLRARILAPTWTSVAIAAAAERAMNVSQELDQEEGQFESLGKRIEEIRSELRQTHGTHDRVKLTDEKTKKELKQASSERRKKRLAAEFREIREDALREIRENSRLAAIFEGPIEKQVQRLIAIPSRRLDGGDIQTMIRLAELLALQGDREELEAAEALAAHLLKLFPEDDGVTAVLLRLVPRLLQQMEKSDCSAASEEVHKKLLARTEEQERKIVEKWLDTDRRSFLALYWYTELWQRTAGMTEGDVAGLLRPEKIKDRYFADAPDEYENLLGWVHFVRAEYAEAAMSFDRAIELQPKAARYHFYLGQCRQKLNDSAGARTEYCEARELEPVSTEYTEGLASALNQAGDRYLREGLFADAADSYAQAMRLDSGNAAYHLNLALAREQTKLPDTEAALKSAILEIQAALDLSPRDKTRYLDEERRLKTRLAAHQCYGSSRVMDFATAVTTLAVEYGSDLEPFIRNTSNEETGNDLRARYAALQDRIEHQYGVSIPKARWRLNETNMSADRYLVMVREFIVVDDIVQADKKVCFCPSGELQELGLNGDPAYDPCRTREAVWLSRKDWPVAEAKELRLHDPLDYVLSHMEEALISRLHVLLGYQDVVWLLRGSPSRDVLKIADSPVQAIALTEMLRALLAERAPISDFDGLCERFLKLSVRNRPLVVAELMRRSRGVRERLWGNSKSFTLLPLGPKFTRLISGSLLGSGVWQVLALEPQKCQEALSAVREATTDILLPAIVIDEPALRIHVRKLIEVEFPDIPVLARREMLKGLMVDGKKMVEL